jgi:isovaleryl-CoA dehydrogenase
LGSQNLGILGLTVPEEFGGTGFINATAVAIVHEELSYVDPAFCLSYLAHSVLLCNNLAVNGSREQVSDVFLLKFIGLGCY